MLARLVRQELRHHGTGRAGGTSGHDRHQGQACELRVGREIFYLGSDTGKLTVRRGPAPDGDAVVTMSADTLYSLRTGQMTVTDAVRHSTVDGDTEIARRALEPLAAAGTPLPPDEAPGGNHAAPTRQQTSVPPQQQARD
jgi:hypothetical protein